MTVSGLTPDEVAEACTYRLKPNTSEPNTAVAKVIEDAGDIGSLLT